MATRYTVTLADQDITRFVSQVPAIVDSVGLYGQIAINEINSITGINASGFWDPQNPASPFHGADPKDYKLTITRDGVTIYDGFILSITVSGRTATVNLQSALTRAIESGCLYTTEVDEQTPAEAVQDIALLYEIPVDTASFSASNTEYRDNNVFVELELTRPDLTVFQVFQSLAEIGVAALSVVKGQLRFDLFRTRTSSSIFTFTDSALVRNTSLLSIPDVASVEKDRTQGYSIETMQGIASLGSDTDQGKTISAGNESAIRIKSLSAGIWIGEKWIEYLNRPQRRITFQTRAGIGRGLPLFSPIDIDYTGGGWNTVTADCVSVDNSSRITSTIMAETR